jgi:hypothetical protein
LKRFSKNKEMQQEQLTEKKRKKLKLHKRFSNGTGWFIKKSLVMAVKVKGGAEKKPKQGSSNVFVPKFCDAEQFKSSGKKLEVVRDGSRDKYKEFMDTEFIKVSVGIFSGKAEKVAKALTALLDFFEQKKKKKILIKCCATEKNFNFFKKSPGFESVNLQFRNLDSQGHDVPVSVCIDGVTISAVIESQFLKGSSQVVTGAVIIPEIAQYLAENEGRGQFRDQYAIYEELRRRTPLLFIFSSAGAVGTGCGDGSVSDGGGGSGGSDGGGGGGSGGSDGGGGGGSGGSDVASEAAGDGDGGGSGGSDVASEAAGSDVGGGSPDGGDGSAGGGGSVVPGSGAGGSGGGGSDVASESESAGSSGYYGGSEGSVVSGNKAGSDGSDVGAGEAAGGGGSEAGGGSDDKSVVSVSETSVIIESDRESFSDDGGGGVAAGAGGGGEIVSDGSGFDVGGVAAGAGGGGEIVSDGGGFEVGDVAAGAGGGGAGGGGAGNIVSGSDVASKAEKETAAVDELKKKIKDLNNYLFNLKTQIIPKSTLEVLNIIDANILKKIKKIDVMYDDKITKTEEIKKKKNYLDAKYREFKNALENQKFKIITLEIFTIKVKQQAKRKKKKKQEAEAAELAETQGQEETAAAENAEPEAAAALAERLQQEEDELNTPTELQQEADEAVQLATVETTAAEAVSKRKRKRDEANSERKRKRSKYPVLDIAAAAETELAAEQPQKAAPQQQKEAELNTILSYTEQTAAIQLKKAEEAAELERQQKAAEDAEVERKEEIKKAAIKKIIKKIKDAKQNMEKNNYSEIFKNLFFSEIKRANNILQIYDVEQFNVEEISNSVKIDEEKLAKIKEKEASKLAVTEAAENAEVMEQLQQEAAAAATTAAELTVQQKASKLAVTEAAENAEVMEQLQQEAIIELQQEAAPQQQKEERLPQAELKTILHTTATILQKQQQQKEEAELAQQIVVYNPQNVVETNETLVKYLILIWNEQQKQQKEEAELREIERQQKAAEDAEATRLQEAEKAAALAMQKIFRERRLKKVSLQRQKEAAALEETEVKATAEAEQRKQEAAQLKEAEDVAALAEAKRLQEAAEATRLQEAEEAAALAEAKRLKEAEEAKAAAELERQATEVKAAIKIQKKWKEKKQRKEIVEAEKRVDYEFNNMIKNKFSQEDIKNLFLKVDNANKIFLNYSQKKIYSVEYLEKFVQENVEKIRAAEAAEVERQQRIKEAKKAEEAEKAAEVEAEQRKKEADMAEKAAKAAAEVMMRQRLEEARLKKEKKERKTRDFEQLRILVQNAADREVNIAYDNAIKNVTKENIKNFYEKVEEAKNYELDNTDKIDDLNKEITKEITNAIDKLTVLNYDNYEIIKAKINDLTEFNTDQQKKVFNDLLNDQNTKLLKREIIKLTYNDFINDNNWEHSFSEKKIKFNITDEEKKIAHLIFFKFQEMNQITVAIDKADAEVNRAYKKTMTNVTEENIKNFYAKINAVNEIFSDNNISNSINYTKIINDLKTKIKKEIKKAIDEFTVLNDEDYKTIRDKINDLTKVNYKENEKAELYNLLDAKKNKLQIEEITKEISELTYDAVINNFNEKLEMFLEKINTFEISYEEKSKLNQLLTAKFEEINRIRENIDSADAEVNAACTEAMDNITKVNIENFYAKIDAVNKIFTENQISNSTNYTTIVNELKKKITKEINKDIKQFTVLTDYETIQAKIQNLTELYFNENEKTKLNKLLDDKYTKLQVEEITKEISELTYDAVINDIYNNNNYLQDDFYGKIYTFQISNEEKSGLYQMLSTKYEEKNQIKKNIDSADAEVNAANYEAMANAIEENMENLKQKISKAYEIFEHNGKPGYKDYSEYIIGVEIKILDDKLAEQERIQKEAEDIINEQQRQVEELRQKEEQDEQNKLNEKIELKKAAEKENNRIIKEQQDNIDSDTIKNLNKIMEILEINSTQLVQDEDKIKQLNNLKSFDFEPKKRIPDNVVNAFQELNIITVQTLTTISEIESMVTRMLVLINFNYFEKNQIGKKKYIEFEEFPEKKILELNEIFEPSYIRAKNLQQLAINAEKEINKIKTKVTKRDNTIETDFFLKRKIEERELKKQQNKQQKEEEIIQLNTFNFRKSEELKNKKIKEAAQEKILSELRAIDSANKIKEFLDIEISKETRNNNALDYQFEKLSNLYERNKNIQAIADIVKEYSETIANIKEENRRKTENENENRKRIKDEKERLEKTINKRNKRKEQKNKKIEQRNKENEEKETERKLQLTEINLSKITNEKKNKNYYMAALVNASYPLLVFAAIGSIDSVSAIPELLSGEVGAVFLNHIAFLGTLTGITGYIGNWNIDANKEKITKILKNLIGKTEKEKENIYNTLPEDEKKLIDDLNKNMDQAIEENAATAKLEKKISDPQKKIKNKKNH